MKKNILLIGVGGTGSNAVDTFFKKYHELGNQTDNKVTALVFDTDAGDLKRITAAKTVAMSDTASVGTICDRLGKEHLREWFPCDVQAVRSQEMVRGASQWRKKSYLAFLNLMNKSAERSVFISALEDMVQDPGASCEVYVIASVAGGTGSGSFIPIALYAKRYIRKALGKDPIVNAMIALPDIYADSQTPENRIKVYSNAYAILRELNAINLVSRNYNAGLAAKKKAPIRFRIGSPDEPNVGVLFDASDKRFWTPEAAPFSQVFLLDRIPGLNSVAAHDMVLANSLYTIICTEIGAAFDSEFSNHELVRSQNNGSNAIYAGISTSQIRFPKDSVLEYLACKKTYDSCNGEWLIIHQAVENAIAEKGREAKAMKRTFIMENDAYARMLIEKVEEKQDENCDEVISLVERGVDQYNEKGERRSETIGELFLETIEGYISSKVPVAASIDAELEGIFPRDLSGGTFDKSNVISAAVDSRPILDKFYRRCFDTVKSIPTSTADAIITLEKKKIGVIGDKYSVVKNLLETKNGKMVHPVAAMIRLCQFRIALSEKLSVEPNDWPELKLRKAPALPEGFLTLDDKGGRTKSAYLGLGKTRFAEISDADVEPEEYNSKRTNATADMEALHNDVQQIANNVANEAYELVSFQVYSRIAADVDLLIAKYRNFFNRFEKEKEMLEDLTKDALRKDEDAIDSIINVYCSQKNKESIRLTLEEGNGPVTSEAVADTDDIVGRGVFASVFASAVAERSEDTGFNDKDSSAYRSLFSSMIAAYRTSIAKSELFGNIASYNVVEAIVTSCGDGASSKEIDDALRVSFSVAQDLAIPSLRLDVASVEDDLVVPSHIMVFMMSKNTARYIKRNAEKFGLSIPNDQNSEGAMLKACAEAFIRDFSGNSSARVAIVDSIPDQVLYCTGEVMDITPLRIAKFNELGEDCVYFKNYTEALARYKRYETDMWNPHLGNNLNKRGCLPYMNAKMEQACDEKMVKALIYGFQSGTIRYTDGMGEARGRYYFSCNGTKITDPEGKWINNKNIAQLLAWMRNEDELVEKWSARFDADVLRQKNALPSLASDNEGEVRNLEATLTNSPIIRILTESLYADSSRKTEQRPTADGEWNDRVGPTALEFAYMIKTSEELGRDCDDAERILRVLYKTFKEMISHRTSPETTPERFIQVYKQQLSKVYESFAGAEIVCRAGNECAAHFTQLVNWLQAADVFYTISDDMPMDETGKVLINSVFDYNRPSSKVKSVLNAIKNRSKKIASAPAEDAKA
ncbi:MAG: hypothetical protein IJ345_01140 [Clostridia bacterium]|nr:hypothetical protein [Clostridia bacterium]